jgi:hypothetical protein
MTEEKERKGCRYEGVIYRDKSELCIDMNCFRCEDGELHVYAGSFPG